MKLYNQVCGTGGGCPLLRLTRSVCAVAAVAGVQVKKAAPYEQPSSSSAPSQAEDIAIGKLRGEDYNFEFQGKPKDGKMHFRLFMTQVRS